MGAVRNALRVKLVDIPLEGHLTEPALAATLRAAAQQLEPPCAMVVDCLAMDDYDPEARRAFVEWHKAHKGRVSAVAILTSKASWRLVISAMALASGQRMKPFADRASAEAWIRSLG